MSIEKVSDLNSVFERLESIEGDGVVCLQSEDGPSLLVYGESIESSEHYSHSADLYSKINAILPARKHDSSIKLILPKGNS